MKEKRVMLLFEGGEPSVLTIDNKEYDWNGQFDVEEEVVRSLSTEEFPLNALIKPCRLEDEVIHSVDGDFGLKKVKDDWYAVVESHQYSKFWSHPIISLPCYIEALKEEIEAGKEFEMIHFDNDDDIHVDYSYQTKLEGVESVSEAMKLAQDAIKTLERRVKFRILNLVKEWTESA